MILKLIILSFLTYIECFMMTNLKIINGKLKTIEKEINIEETIINKRSIKDNKIQLTSLFNSMKNEILEEKKTIAVIGPTGNLGREVVNKLLKKNVKIKILNRHKNLSKIINNFKSKSNIELVEGDITDITSLTKLLIDCDVCLTLHGSNRITRLTDFLKGGLNDKSHPMYVNYIGMKNLAEAALITKKCKHIIRISGNNENPWSILSVLINLIGSMTKAWNYGGDYELRNSNLKYTIIKPGLMTKEKENTTIDIVDSSNVNNKNIKVSYDTISDICIECIDNENVINSTISVKKGDEKKNIKSLLNNIKRDNIYFENKYRMIGKHYIATISFVITILMLDLGIFNTILKLL